MSHSQDIVALLARALIVAAAVLATGCSDPGSAEDRSGREVLERHALFSIAPRSQAGEQLRLAFDSILPQWSPSPPGGGRPMPGDPQSVLTWVSRVEPTDHADPHLVMGMAPHPLRLWVNGRLVHSWSDPDATTSPVDWSSNAFDLGEGLWNSDGVNRVVLQVFPRGGSGRLPNLALLDRREASARVWRTDLLNHVLPAVVMVTGLFLSAMFLVLFFQLGRERWARVWFWLTSALFSVSLVNMVFSAEEMEALPLWKIGRIALCLASLAIVHLQVVQAGWNSASRRLLPWTAGLSAIVVLSLWTAADHATLERRFEIFVALILGPSLCANLAMAWRNFYQRKGASEAWMLAGLVLFALAGFHDLVVYLRGVLPDAWFYPMGFLAMDFCLALAVSHDLVALWSQNRQRAADLEFALHGQQQAKARAEEAVRARNRFLEQMAHRFRTPLQGLSGALDLGKDAALTPEILAGLENHLRSHVAHINDVIDHIDLEAGRLEVKSQVFDLSDLVETWRRHPVFGGHGGGLLVLESNLRLRADRDRVERVVRTLIEHLADPGLELSLHGRVRVEQDPQGPGALVVALQASRPVRSLLDPSNELLDGGVALDLLRALGGTLEIERESTVVLRFPAEVIASEVSSSFGQDARPLVLLAEDDRVNARILVSLLEKVGCRTVHALDGAQALEKAALERPTLILMDVMMPVMDGLEATRRIRQDRRLQGVPVVGVTAHGNSADCLSAGMDEMLAKPVRADQIRDVVARYCPVDP